MKVKVKSVLRSSEHAFQCFDENQILFQAGNTLCIKQIAKNESQFICLQNKVQKVYSFKPTPSRKHIFTAEKINKSIEIGYYSLKEERKFISLTDHNNFFNADTIEKVELLADEYDNSVIYGVGKTKEAACLFMVDMSKNRVMATGFIPNCEHVKVNTKQNLAISVCGHNGSSNFVKNLTYLNGQWEVQQKIYKKVHNGVVFHHEYLEGNRLLLATRTHIYIFDDNELFQTIDCGGLVESILRIPKGLMVIFTNQKIKLFVEDSDQMSLLPFQFVKIDLKGQDKIAGMRMSFNNEEVILRTFQHDIFVWKCEALAISQGTHPEFQFLHLEEACVSDKQGSLTISTGKKYCLLSGLRSITLWNIQKNENVLSQELISEGGNKRTIFACAISPDGNSFIVALEDKIRIYKILLTKFKMFAQFGIKRCQSIVFSHGGQLAACKSGRGNNSSIVIINILRLIEINTIKLSADPTQIIWNELDDELIVSADNQTIQCYRIADNVKLYSQKMKHPINYIRIDYKTRHLVVSTDGSIQIVQQGNIIDSLQPAIDQFYYAFPLYGGYLGVSKTGSLYVANSLKFQNATEISVLKKPFHLLCRNGYLMAYSSLSEIITLQCTRLNYVPKKTQLAEDIVLIERDEINSMMEKVKQIQTTFELLQNSTQIKLEEEKQNYQQSLLQISQKFRQEIAFQNKKFSQLNYEKLKQEKQSEKMFEQLEGGQVKSVYELQKMYDRKFKMERQKFMNLEQSNLEQKLKYEKIIYDLEDKYHKQVTSVRQQYSSKLKEEYNKIEEIKKQNLQYKKRMEMKVIDIEEENEITMYHLQEDKDSIIRNMVKRYTELEEKYDKTLIDYHNQMSDLQRLKDNSESHEEDKRRMINKIQQSLNRIKLLEGEISKKNLMIDERNQLIEQQEHQIGGLQKAKYVLSFRTTEIRKQLEPKQTLIDKLKEERSKLDEEYKNEQKKNFQLRQRLQKVQKINQIAKKENSDFKISLKNKERVHDELCSEIFMIINTIDPKEWNSNFVKIYQAYIKEDKFKSRQSKKKDDTSEEINRHLMHVEQSLLQVSTGNDKILKGKQKDVIRKMKENSELVYDLNIMRKKQNQYLNQIKEKNNEIARLKRQIHQSNKYSTRAHTANTGLTKRVIASRDVFSREKSNILDVNDFESVKKQLQLKTKNKERSRIASAHKTLMFRQQKREKSQKLFDIAKELETARNTIKRQDRMIEQLNQRLMGLPEEDQ